MGFLRKRTQNNEPLPADEPKTEAESNWHARTVYSTKPGHAKLRTEQCDCAHGAKRGGCMAYESP
jgi:hypothetical protein